MEELFNIEIYFTDPYCAWQKGTVENLNRQLRRYYPKATDISMIDTEELMMNVEKINQQPKKHRNNRIMRTRCYIAIFSRILNILQTDLLMNMRGC